jgi:hypothetical protein
MGATTRERRWSFCYGTHTSVEDYKSKSADGSVNMCKSAADPQASKKPNEGALEMSILPKTYKYD